MKVRIFALFIFALTLSLNTFSAQIEIKYPADTEHSPLFIPSEQTSITVTGDLMYTPQEEENQLSPVVCNNKEATIVGERTLSANTKIKEWTVSLPLESEGIYAINCY